MTLNFKAHSLLSVIASWHYCVIQKKATSCLVQDYHELKPNLNGLIGCLCNPVVLKLIFLCSILLIMKTVEFKA